MAEAYAGVVVGGVVVPTMRARKLPEGTPVLVVAQPDWEHHWLTVSQAGEQFGASPRLIRRWVESGKVRVCAENPKLVNAGDVEDAVDQWEILSLTMEKAAKHESP